MLAGADAGHKLAGATFAVPQKRQRLPKEPCSPATEVPGDVGRIVEVRTSNVKAVYAHRRSLTGFLPGPSPPPLVNQPSESAACLADIAAKTWYANFY